MNSLFATPGIATATTVVLVLQVFSLLCMCAGLLSHRTIVAAHRAFFLSLHHAGKQAKYGAIRRLIRIYILSTILIVSATSIFYFSRLIPSL